MASNGYYVPDPLPNFVFHSIVKKMQGGCYYHSYFINEETSTREIKQFSQDHTASIWSLCVLRFLICKIKMLDKVTSVLTL